MGVKGEVTDLDKSNIKDILHRRERKINIQKVELSEIDVIGTLTNIIKWELIWI